MKLLFLFLAVLFIGYVATLCWFHLARKRRWLDRPNHRSSHAMPTPTSGGIGFVIAFASFVFVLFHWQVITVNQLLMLSVAIFLAFTGFIDDLKNLSIQKRLLTQFATCLFVAFAFDGSVVFVISDGLQLAGIVVRILLFVGLLWLINLYNFMDGIDGLAVTEAIYFSLAIAFFALVERDTVVSIVALGLALSLCGFLYFNLSPAKLFMGDLGSNYLGLVLGVLGILGMESGAVNVWTILVLLGVFIVDSTITLVTRMMQGAIWYHGHNSHAYQHAARRFKSHGMVVILVSGINVVWLFPLAWLTVRYEETGLLLTVLAWAPLVLLAIVSKKTGLPTQIN